MTPELHAQLLLHEGLRLFPYKDTVGKITIGVGRNLTDKGISKAEAFLLLDNDVVEVVKALHDRLPWFAALDAIRQRVLIDMAFNMGIVGLLKFKRTLASIERGAYDTAATQMLESKWAGQVGRRALRLSAMTRTGTEP